jgi:hypothetical protein
MSVHTSAFLFLSTGSGVFLDKAGVPPRSLVASARQLAWNARLPTMTASSHTHSCAESSHLFSKRSWQMGQMLLTPLDGSGTGMYCSLGSLAAFAAAVAEADSSTCDARSMSTVSRVADQSYFVRLVRGYSHCFRLRREENERVERMGEETYLNSDVPAPVLASLLCLGNPLMYSEVPVHVRHLLLPTFLVSCKPPAALRAGGA